MEINLKDTLRALRQKKNVTQEALAGYLGITGQSVGKWERGEGFPDITLLPNIALFFGVTIDELLDVGQARIDEKINRYMDESLKHRNKGENEENLALWERAYEEFPNDCRVMRELMFAINKRNTSPYPAEDVERIKYLGERILSESNDTEIREEAVQKLCYMYDSLGETDNALRYANMGGSMYITRDDLRADVIKGEEGVEEAQNYLIGLINLAVSISSRILEKTDFTDEYRISAYKFQISLWKLLFSDGNVGFYANDLSYRCIMLAILYAKTQNRGETLAALEECVRYAIIEAGVGEMSYTAPMVNRVRNNPSGNTKNYKGNACNLRLSGIEWSGFDFIRDDPRFRKAEEELKKYAEAV